MSTCRTLDYRDCPHHGRSLHRSCHCIECAKDGIPPPIRPPIKEPISAWMAKAIRSFGDGDPKPKRPSRQSTGVRGRGRPLSEFERNVFVRLGYGVRLIDMAAELGVDAKAVSNTIYRLQNKYRVSDREQLRAVAKAAARAGE